MAKRWKLNQTDPKRKGKKKLQLLQSECFSYHFLPTSACHFNLYEQAPFVGKGKMFGINQIMEQIHKDALSR